MSITPGNLTLNGSRRAAYAPVQLEVLRWSAAVGVDLFAPGNDKNEPLLFHRGGRKLPAGKLAELQTAGVESLYVRSCDFAALSSNVLESLEDVLQQEEVPGAERFAALQLAVAVEVEHTLRRADCDQFVMLADRVGNSLATLVQTGNLLPRDMFRIARHDFSTFTHVTNVAGYSVLLADKLGLSNADELKQIASGAMLHDLGKRTIPKQVLTKPSRLSPEERELIESHPQRGYEELCERADLSFGQLMMVYQHHEHIDGRGYPVRILGDEIHPWAKLLAVVDVFDALTGKRPYRRPMSTQAAIDHIRARAGRQFDPEITACWSEAITQT